MNKRIRELADQCYHQYSEHNIDLEKFAELIIQECANVASVCDQIGVAVQILDLNNVK
jgi:hypothetical protein